MTIDEFAKDLHQEILSRAEDSPNYAADVFTERAIDAMTDAGEADGHILCNSRRRGFKVNAFNISEDGDCVDLFVTLYNSQDPPPKVPNSDVERHFTWVQSFFTRCLSDSYRAGLEESSAEFDAAHSIHSARDLITRGRLFFVTDGITSGADHPDTELNGIKFTHHVWDLGRLYRTETSGAERERIDVWFENDFNHAVSCIASSSDAAGYTTYLGFFPAELLVKIYDRYGSRLLERNVRSFLQARGKINKGIRDTLLREPDRFLAYNNGLSVTAERIEYRDGHSSLKLLTRAIGFQIVNGGQTTASLYAAAKRDKADLSRVSVQVKLTIPSNPSAIDELAPQISRYANSQNKVNTADFSANHPFHLKIEELSRTIWAPAKAGSQLETKWYYERARGSYLDELSRHTPSEQRRWKLQNPPAHKFAKTDLAKFEHSWDQMPHIVSRGAEKNFVDFMVRLGERPIFVPDDDYFRRLIAKGILFRHAEKIVQAQKYGGYRANIVTYTIAWLSHRTAQRLDLILIWRSQGLAEPVEEAIRTISKAAYDHLVIEAKGANVTEWAKREKCWEGFRQKEIVIPTLILADPPTSTLRRSENEHSETPRGNSDEYREVSEYDSAGWFALSHWAKDTANLAPWQRSLAFSLGRLAARGATPSTKQLVQGRKILEEAHRLGFISEAEHQQG